MDIYKKLVEQTLSNLQESNLGRVYQHIKNNEFVTISANRQEKDDETNEKNYRKLVADLKKLNLGWIPAIGFGQEEVNGKIISDVVNGSGSKSPLG